MLRRAMDVTLHRTTPEVKNEAGEVVSGGEPVNVSAIAWAVRASSSVEFAEGRQNLVVRGKALFPPDADVRATDEISAVGVDGIMPIRYRVVGLFPVMCGRRQRVKHLHVDLEAVG